MKNTPGSIGILVFVSQETLEHKRNDGKQCESRFCYWDTARIPKQFIANPDAVKRLYMAVKDRVMGYFVVTNYFPSRLTFFSESWVPIVNGPVLKPSQGWRYFSPPQTNSNEIPIMDDHPDPVFASRPSPAIKEAQ